MPELTFTQIGIAVALLFQLASGIATIVLLINSFRTQKREVRFEHEFVTREDFKDHVQASIQSREDTHRQIEKLQVDVASLQTEAKNTNQNLTLLGAKLDRMIEKSRQVIKIAGYGDDEDSH